MNLDKARREVRRATLLPLFNKGRKSKAFWEKVFSHQSLAFILL